MLTGVAWVQRRRAAGKAGGSRAVARWGSGPGRTLNMYCMFVTCATSQEPMATLKEERHGAPYTRLDMSVTAPVSHAAMWPCAASALVGLPHHSASAPCRLLLSENEVGATTTGREKSRPRSRLEPILVGFEDGGHRCPARRPSPAQPVLTWATRPKQRGAQLSPCGASTTLALAFGTSILSRVSVDGMMERIHSTTFPTSVPPSPSAI